MPKCQQIKPSSKCASDIELEQASSVRGHVKKCARAHRANVAWPTRIQYLTRVLVRIVGESWVGAVPEQGRQALFLVVEGADVDGGVAGRVARVDEVLRVEGLFHGVQEEHELTVVAVPADLCEYFGAVSEAKR